MNTIEAVGENGASEDATQPSSASKSRRRVLAAVFALAIAVAGASSLTAPQDANAWATSGTVTLKGSSYCMSRTTWVWVESSNGERGWATKGSGNYQFNFKKVPAKGMNVRVNFGNSTFKCTTTFGVKRPAVGTTATRNVIQLY